MAKQYRLMLRPKDVPGPVCQHLCGEDDRFEVRDLTTRTCVEVRVRDISPYRHSLFLDGKEFHILNLVGQ